MNRCFAVYLITLVACHPDLVASNPNGPPSPKPQELYEAYWTAEPGWHTEIQIRNNYAAQNLDVQAVLRTSNGAEIPLPPVTIAPDDSQVFDVGSALSAAAPQLQPTDA